MKQPVIDYRKLRLNNFFKEYRHLLLLLWRPIYGVAFTYIERYRYVKMYNPVWSLTDYKIPFCEYFLIPYLFWFIFIIGMLLFTLLFDISEFKRFMYFTMITYSITIAIYLIFPTCNILRPLEFERQNTFTDVIRLYYRMDTSTNVCPSLHVIGSIAVMLAGLHSKAVKSPITKALIVLSAILIGISTVFVKQHSILDIIWAMPVCLLGYLIVYFRIPSRKKTLQQDYPGYT